MRALLYILIILIPLRDWNFAVGFDFYAIDVVAVMIVVKFVFDLTIKPVKFAKTELVLLIGILVGVIVSFIPILLSFSYFTHGLIGLAKLIIYYVVALAFLSELRGDFFKRKVLRLQMIYFIGFALLALANFLSVGIGDIDFIGDLFDSVSIRGPEVFNHLELSFWTRNSSFAGEPNFLAIYALMHYGVVLSTKLNTFSRAIHVVLVALVVISTFSRVGLLLFPILFALNELKLDFRSIFVYLSLILSMFYVLSNIIHADVYVTEILKSIAARDYSGDKGREHIYIQALNIWLNNPLGVGISNYGIAAFDRYGLSGEPNPHNGFLTLLIEQGLLGLFAKLILYAHLLRRVLKNHGAHLFFTMSLILTSVFVNNFDKILGFDLFFILIGHERLRQT